MVSVHYPNCKVTKNQEIEYTLSGFHSFTAYNAVKTLTLTLLNFTLNLDNLDN